MKDLTSTLSTTPRLHQSHRNKMDEASSKQNDNDTAAVKTKMVSLPNSVNDEYNDYGMCTHVDLTLIANAVQDCVKNNNNSKKLSWSNLHVMFQYAKSFEDIIIDEDMIQQQNVLLDNNASTIATTTTMSNNNNENNITNNIDHENDDGDADDSKLMGGDESHSRFVLSTTTNGINTKRSCLKGTKTRKNNTNNNNRVKFSTVQIREYAITVGDHPFCSNGIPLSLDWSYNTNMQTMDLLQEDCTTTHDPYHRHPPVHKMSYIERKNKLRRIMNYSEGQIRHEEHQRIIQLQSELIFGNSNNKSIRRSDDDDEDDEYHYDDNNNDEDNDDENNITTNGSSSNNNNNSGSSNSLLLHRSTSSCTNLMDLSQNFNKFGLCSQ